MNTLEPARLLAAFNQTKQVALLTHRKPDGDALGSLFGLGRLLEERGIGVSYVSQDPIPGHYEFLKAGQLLLADIPAEADLVGILDCGADRLSGFDVSGTGEHALFEIDHHPKAPQEPARIRLHDPGASSTAELIYELARQAGWRLDRYVATCLLTGIISDTSAFQNANTTPRTMQVAAALLRAGANRREIIRQCFFTSSLPKLKLWGRAMARIEQHGQTAGIVSTVLTKEDILECGAHPDDLEGLVNFLNAIPGVPALLLLTDLRQGEVKGSFRTRDDRIDVSALAGIFGGGGHRQAAGFSVPGALRHHSDDSWEVVAPQVV